MKKNIAIIGASGHAKVIIDIIEKQGIYNIIGLIDSFKVKGEFLSSYKILGTEEMIPDLINEHNLYGGIIAIGDNWKRNQICVKIETLTSNFNLISAVHPNASIGKGVKIGEGSCIMAGSVVNADAEIGKCCIINSISSLGHDCVMQAFSSLALGSNVGGHVKIGLCTAIGIGASVIGSITINDHSVIGAGAVVTKSITNNKVVYGVPARIIRSRNIGDDYLSPK
jgi:sugar O-acyltransferase (sialic acid O-acetyltransferase NeuD family)